MKHERHRPMSTPVNQAAMRSKPWRPSLQSISEAGSWWLFPSLWYEKDFLVIRYLYSFEQRKWIWRCITSNIFVIKIRSLQPQVFVKLYIWHRWPGIVAQTWQCQAQKKKKREAWRGYQHYHLDGFEIQVSQSGSTFVLSPLQGRPCSLRSCG